MLQRSQFFLVPVHSYIPNEILSHVAAMVASQQTSTACWPICHFAICSQRHRQLCPILLPCGPASCEYCNPGNKCRHCCLSTFLFTLDTSVGYVIVDIKPVPFKNSSGEVSGRNFVGAVMDMANHDQPLICTFTMRQTKFVSLRHRHFVVGTSWVHVLR